MKDQIKIRKQWEVNPVERVHDKRKKLYNRKRDKYDHRREAE